MNICTFTDVSESNPEEKETDVEEADEEMEHPVPQLQVAGECWSLSSIDFWSFCNFVIVYTVTCKSFSVF